MIIDKIKQAEQTNQDNQSNKSSIVNRIHLLYEAQTAKQTEDSN